MMAATNFGSISINHRKWKTKRVTYLYVSPQWKGSASVSSGGSFLTLVWKENPMFFKCNDENTPIETDVTKLTVGFWNMKSEN